MSINIKPSHKGLLHRDLHVKSGKHLTVKQEEKAAHSKNPAERKRAVFALNARHFSHHRGK